MTRPPPSPRARGFSSVELLLVVAMSSIIMGGVVVSYGTLVKNQPRLSAVVSVPLGTATMTAFYGTSASTMETPSAPNFTGLSRAEELRESFISDITSASAVFCLGRDVPNTYKPSNIAFDPALHGELDTPQKFRAHLLTLGAVSSSQYRDYRNPDGSSAAPVNASIFILGFSKFTGFLKVTAIYDIDVVRFSTPQPTAEPWGLHASVKRFADPTGVTLPTALVYAGSYEVFYPPSVLNATTSAQWATDGFTPLFVTFERSARLALLEGIFIDRFKRATERPFYLVWWPDPCARHLGPATNTFSAADPRQAYNQMAGRTSFMFTVPMFPAL